MSAGPAVRNDPISFVVPVYNSAATLPELVRRLTEVARECGRLHEIVLVNDGSADNSWRGIGELCARDERVRGVDLVRNFGQHNALLAGIRLARYPVIVTLDDDLQNPPEEVPKLLAKLDDGWDVVYGSPNKAEYGRQGLWRRLATQLTKLALKTAMGSDIARQASAFRAFRTNVRDAFAEYRGPFVSIDVLLTWGTRQFTAVTTRHDPRSDGRSSYTFRKLVTHAMNMATGFSTRPLQIASLTGFGFAAIGLVVLIYVLIRRIFEGNPVPGFPFLASIIAIFSGAQLFALGIIGEYLARMHFRMMDKPAYVIRASTDDDAR
jgi:undecaprenyl-phosphate 4-deoxy-4-formamido-L-arabinose transferase